MPASRIAPIRFIQFESAVAKQAQSLIFAAGSNLTITPVQSGSRVTLTFAATGGGGGTPAGSVVAETSFGASSAVGVGTDYARADHTHGTPSLGSTGTTACAGDDARLSDARTPTAHTHVLADITDAGALAAVNDAPSDGQTYGRNNGAWSVAGGGSGLTRGVVDQTARA